MQKKLAALVCAGVLAFSIGQGIPCLHATAETMDQSQIENNQTVQEKNELCTDFQSMNAHLYAKTGMTIEESLNDQLNHYCEALLNCGDEEKNLFNQ